MDDEAVFDSTEATEPAAGERIESVVVRTGDYLPLNNVTSSPPLLPNLFFFFNETHDIFY